MWTMVLRVITSVSDLFIALQVAAAAISAVDASPQADTEAEGSSTYLLALACPLALHHGTHISVCTCM